METAGHHHHHQSSKLKSMEDDHDLLVVDIEKKKRASCNSTIINFKKASSSINGVMSSSSSQRCCQADKCSVDLSDAKQYHRRHKVCEYHAKAQAVVVAGLRQRFCQQCSRFHEVMEFDESKRSCRRRLAGHNERRRRTTSSSSSTAATEATNNNNAEGSIGRKLGTGTINSMCGQVDDRGRRIQENATNYKINNFHLR